MTKYKPLSDRLTGHSADEWRASFSDVEEVLGFPLPKGARTGRAWWANDGDKSHHKAWGGVGWQVGDVDPATGYVTFRRAEANGFAPDAKATPDPVQPEAMRKASEKLSRSSAFRDVAPAAIVAGVAVVAGIAAMVARKAFRKTA
jgi:hypothetical protein